MGDGSTLPAVAMFPASDHVAEQLAALRALAPRLEIATEPAACDPHRTEAILCFGLAAGLAARLPRLRLVASVGAGVSNILASGELVPHVAVTRVVDPAQAGGVAQYVVGQLLRHFREFERYRDQQREGLWQRWPARDAAGCQVGLLGLGHIARPVAGALHQLGLPVIGWSRSGRAFPELAGVFAGPVQLDEFLSACDCLLCLLPGTRQTRGLLGVSQLRRLRPGAFLINVSRGGIVDETALVALLDEGHLGGAALDVFAEEPLPLDSPLWRHEKIMLTPHIAANPSVAVTVHQFLDNLCRLRDGAPLLHTIDRQAEY